jgi:drug/metabolite transporter (DMT)-like permease
MSMTHVSRDTSFHPENFVLLTAAILGWGTNWTIMKIALGHSTPLWITGMRFLIGAAFLFAIVAARQDISWPSRADMPIVFSVGLLQMLGNGLLVIVALRYVPPGRSAVLAYTTPLWVTPLALLLGERPSARKLGGTVLGLAGMALLFNPLSIDWHNGRVIFGQLLLLAAALSWSICIVHIRGHHWHASALELAPWQMLLAGIPLLLAARLFDGPIPGDNSPAFWATILYIGLVATAFCYWAVVAANRRLSATTTSNAMLGVPVVGLIISALVTGESLDASLLAGMAMMLAGIAVVASADR